MLGRLSPKCNRIITMAEFLGFTVLETLKACHPFTGTSSFSTNLPTNVHFLRIKRKIVIYNNTCFESRRLYLFSRVFEDDVVFAVL